MHKKAKYIFLVLSLILIFASCSKQEVVLSDQTFALDTLIDIKIYQYSNDKNDESVIDDSFKLIKSLEDILSVHFEGSDVYNIKANAGKQPVEVNEITYRLIKDSIKFSELTDGLFDVTTGPLIDLWAIDPPNGHLPSQNELDVAIPLIDYHKINFQKDNRIMLEDEGMIINLGAIAKGSIADEVKNFLLQKGVTHAMINLGGNVLLIGSKPDGSSFKIGIQDPNDDRGAYLMSIQAADEAIVSSGDYERYFVYEGETYHHILNPKTGFPADTNIKQVTIVAPNSQMADGLSTSVLLLGLKKGIDLVEATEQVEAIFITKDNMIYITDGLKDKYKIQDDLMQNYTLVNNLQDLKE